MKQSSHNLRNAIVIALMSTAAVTATAQNVRAPNEKPHLRKQQKDEGWQIKQRDQWFIESRGLDQVDGKKARVLRAKAVHEAKDRMKPEFARNLSAGEVWTPIGPAAMRMGQMEMGPVSGRLNVIAQHPTNSNTLYLGTAAGGVWRSTNLGASWEPIFDSVGTLPIGSIFIEPAAPNNIWVGTGDKNFACAGYMSEGIFHSADGGNTWTQKNGSGPAAMQAGVISTIVAHPTNSNVLLAAGGSPRYGCGNGTDYGLYRTTNRGDSWTRVINHPIEDIVFVPNSSTAYATVASQGVYRSTDGGLTWSSLSTGIEVTHRMRLVIAPSDPATLYLLTENKLYRSTNGGTTWVQRSTSACTGQCWYNLSMAVHPANPNELLVGSLQVMRSTDGGTNFTPLSDYWGKVHPDIQVLRYTPGNGNQFWVGTDGGLWRSDNAGTSFVNMNSNLNITQFYDVTPHPDNADIVFGGAQDNSSARRTNGDQWDLSILTGDGFVNIVDGNNPNIVFQTSYPGGQYPNIYRSMQGGALDTFQWLPTNGLDAGPFTWETTLASAGSHIFVASDKVYRGLMSAENFIWSPISPQVSANISALTLLREGTASPGYFGTSIGQVFYTANAAATTVTWNNVSGSASFSNITDIAIDPTNKQRVFVLASMLNGPKLFRSTTGGGSWTQVGNGIPDVSTKAVAIDPLNVNRIFVGTDVGVYVSTNGGQDFAPFMTGYPLGAAVEDLEIDNNPYVLIAGTYGRGAWKVPLQSSGNQAPVAGFNQTINGLTATFTDTSTDADGTVVLRNWNFGDGTSSSLTNPSKTFAAPGSYTVTLTVTDNQGGVDTETRTINVGQLTNGVAVTGLSAASGGEIRYTLSVPANATNLKFTSTGSSGNADLYVRFGSPPTPTNYLCRSITSGSNETCNIATAQAGTYHVLVRGTTAFSGLSLTGSHGLLDLQTYINPDNYNIYDNSSLESPITVSGRTGNAPSNAKVTVNIVHTFIADLKVDLVAPDGSVYVLHNYSGGSANNINATYTVNLTSEPRNGIWKLRVADIVVGDTGYLDQWSLTF